jgi:hypothetical protein
VDPVTDTVYAVSMGTRAIYVIDGATSTPVHPQAELNVAGCAAAPPRPSGLQLRLVRPRQASSAEHHPTLAPPRSGSCLTMSSVDEPANDGVIPSRVVLPT